MMITTDWRELASCRGVDPELFYPVGDGWTGPGNAVRAERAKAVCAGCPVRAECLADAYGDDWSIRGGTLPAERLRLTARVA